MRTQKLIFLLALGFLVACNTTTQPDNSNDHSTEPTKISTSSLPDQSPSEQAKNMLQKYDETTNIYAVNTNKTMLIAYEVHHHDRLKLAKFEKKLKKKLKKQFDDFKIEVSTDKKLVMEINELEKKVSQKKIGKKKLKKEVKHLIALSHDKT
ncbi:YhcN/YlaJ family sporulation lipoprotein [Virgibacillus necropolis]|uniref:YhcN/YlaJ family sporulation lipoprotein n=1 Tax=Virgibacillus necropolis TaxID=163877 RepID=UPI0038516739